MQDVQQTGLQSTQTRRNLKQGGIFEFPSIPTSVAALHVKQPSSFFQFFVTLN